MKYVHCCMIHETRYGLSLSAYQWLKENRIILPHNFRGLGLWSVGSIAFEAVVKQNLSVGSGWEASKLALGQLGSSRRRRRREKKGKKGAVVTKGYTYKNLTSSAHSASSKVQPLPTLPSTHGPWKALKTKPWYFWLSCAQPLNLKETMSFTDSLQYAMRLHTDIMNEVA